MKPLIKNPCNVCANKSACEKGWTLKFTCIKYNHSFFTEMNRCEFCGGKLSEIREHEGTQYRHCYGCHFDYYITEGE